MKIAIIHAHLMGRGGSQRYAIEQAIAFNNLGNETAIFSYIYNKKYCYPELTGEIEIHACKTIDKSDVENYSSGYLTLFNGLIVNPINPALLDT